MDRIASFCINHDTLVPGIYLSRIDGDIKTYDLRFIKPNTPPYLPNPTMHTIEHLFATYVRNSGLKDRVIYFGPMGCRTGFYFLIRDTAEQEALELIKATVKQCIEHEGEIPGSTAAECGNYLEHDPKDAREKLEDYYSIIKNLQPSDLTYPK